MSLRTSCSGSCCGYEKSGGNTLHRSSPPLCWCSRPDCCSAGDVEGVTTTSGTVMRERGMGGAHCGAHPTKSQVRKVDWYQPDVGNDTHVCGWRRSR